MFRPLITRAVRGKRENTLHGSALEMVYILDGNYRACEAVIATNVRSSLPKLS